MARSPQFSQAMYENQVSVRSGLSELKYIPYVLSARFASVSTAGSSLDVAGLVAQGADAGMRIGRSIFIKDLTFDCTFEGGQSNLATDDNHNTIRVAVLEGVPSTLATSLASTGTVSSWLSRETYSGLNRVSLDRMIDLPSPGRDSTGYMPALAHFRAHIPVNKTFVYTGVAGADVSANTILIWMVSDSTTVSHPGVTYGNFCVRYIDA